MRTVKQINIVKNIIGNYCLVALNTTLTKIN